MRLKTLEFAGAPALLVENSSPRPYFLPEHAVRAAFLHLDI
jgi:hypothetical protein